MSSALATTLSAVLTAATAAATEVASSTSSAPAPRRTHPRGNPNPPGYSGGSLDDLDPLSPEELHADRGHEVTVSVAMMIIFSVLFFAGRVASRYMTRVHLRPSDWILLGGIIAAFAMGGCYIWSVYAGAGKHLLLIVQEDRAWAESGTSFKAMFVASNFYFAAIVLVKLSILALFYELFGSSKPFRWAIWFLSGVCVAWFVGFFILNFCLCTPLSDVWSLRADNQHHCISGPHYLINGVSNIVTDLLILFLPIRVVWSMHLATRAKVGLSLVFLMGSFVCVASIFRLAYTMLNANLDPSWDVVVIELWSTIELTVAICCACLLTMRPLLKHVIPSFVSTAMSKRSSRRSGRRTADHGRVTIGGGRLDDGSSVDPKTSRGARGGSLPMDSLGGGGAAGVPGGKSGSAGGKGVSTRVSARPDPFATLVDEESLEEKSAGRIRVTQEGPVFTVEQRPGYGPAHGAGGDASSTEDLERGGAEHASTKELCARD